MSYKRSLALKGGVFEEIISFAWGFRITGNVTYFTVTDFEQCKMNRGENEIQEVIKLPIKGLFNELTQNHIVTSDTLLVAKLLEEGAITEEEAANHPHRNVILFSIGSEKTPKIDLFEIALNWGDKIFLCSDGLTRHLSDDEICTFLENPDLEAAASQMIQMANDRGGQDIISVAIIDYGETGEYSTTEGQEFRVIMPKAIEGDTTSLNRAFLTPYTILLSVVEAILIVIVWLLLRV